MITKFFLKNKGNDVPQLEFKVFNIYHNNNWRQEAPGHPPKHPQFLAQHHFYVFRKSSVAFERKIMKDKILQFYFQFYGFLFQKWHFAII